MYYVTCRHVIQEALKQKVQIYARLNLQEEENVEHIPLYNKWIYHEDDGYQGIDFVDLAVLPVKLIEGTRPNKVLTLGSDLIYGREGMKQHFKRDMQVGDDLTYIGLFQHYSGHNKNNPLVRFGKVPLITQEKLPGVEMALGTSDYFLVECQAYPGMSGAPIFAMKPFEGVEKYFLVGVMAGYYSEDELIEKKFTHFGISLAIPIEKVGDIIWGTKLTEDRRAKLAPAQ